LSCHLGQNNLYHHFLTHLPIFHITLNSQAVAAANQAVSAYLVQLDNSHCAASSANWNAAHHQAAFNKFNAALPIFQALLAAIAHHTRVSAGAVNAISLASSQRVSQTLYAHWFSDINHLLNNHSELACSLASCHVSHLACFILSQAVHSDTSAHSNLAAQYQSSHNQAPI
jgi:hypothetical protein